MPIVLQATLHKSEIAVVMATFSFIVLGARHWESLLAVQFFKPRSLHYQVIYPPVPCLSDITDENASAALLALQALPEAGNQ